MTVVSVAAVVPAECPTPVPVPVVVTILTIRAPVGHFVPGRIAVLVGASPPVARVSFSEPGVVPSVVGAVAPSVSAALAKTLVVASLEPDVPRAGASVPMSTVVTDVDVNAKLGGVSR